MRHARRRLTRKLLVLLLVPTIVCLFVFGVLTARIRRHEMLAEADRELADHVELLRATLPPLAAALPPEQLIATADDLVRHQRVHGLTLYDAAGRALVRTPGLAPHVAQLDVLAAGSLRRNTPVHGVHVLGRTEALVRIEPIAGDRGVAAILVVHDLAPVKAMIVAVIVRLAITGSVLTALLALVAIWLSWALGRGLGELMHGAERVASGDLAVRLDEGGPFETGRAARAFNSMAIALGRARSELDQADVARRDLERRVQHAQGLAIVGEVAASLAHDIGSPLSVILVTARLAAQDESLPDHIRTPFATVATQCERITRIVHRLLGVARPPRESIGSVDLGEIAREVIAFLESDCRRRKVVTKIEIAPDVPAVQGVYDHLLQVVMNLCVNAVQAQPEGGALTIALSREKPDGMFATSEHGAVVLEVRDGGPGVPVEARTQIFEPFFSTRRDRGGTGLGLAVVSRIVQEGGGTVTVGSAPEGGAAFRVVVPAQAPGTLTGVLRAMPAFDQLSERSDRASE